MNLLTNRELKKAIYWILLALGTSILVLAFLDFFRPFRSLSIVWGTLLRIWLLIGALSVSAGLLFGVSWAINNWSSKNDLAVKFRKCATGLGVIAALPMLIGLTELFIYQPIKFNYLIHRIESADTIEEERSAFWLAARLGRVWELNRYFETESRVVRGNDLKDSWVLEVEWWEEWPGGPPYRAYRVVLDEENMKAFREDWIR